MSFSLFSSLVIATGAAIKIYLTFNVFTYYTKEFNSKIDDCSWSLDLNSLTLIDITLCMNRWKLIVRVLVFIWLFSNLSDLCKYMQMSTLERLCFYPNIHIQFMLLTVLKFQLSTSPLKWIIKLQIYGVPAHKACRFIHEQWRVSFMATV